MGTVCWLLGAAAPSGPGPPHSRGFYITHNDAPQSVGLLWTSDQLVVETSLYLTTHNTQQTNIHAPGGVRTHDLSRRAAADLHLRPRGHWDWHTVRTHSFYTVCTYSITYVQHIMCICFELITRSEVSYRVCVWLIVSDPDTSTVYTAYVRLWLLSHRKPQHCIYISSVVR